VPYSWSSRDTRAPHVAVHLCIIVNAIFIYISIVPRANLVTDYEYNDYGTFVVQEKYEVPHDDGVTIIMAWVVVAIPAFLNSCLVFFFFFFVAVYGSPKAALDGRSLNDLHIQCVDDKAFKQYVSKSVRTYDESLLKIGNKLCIVPSSTFLSSRTSMLTFYLCLPILRPCSTSSTRSWFPQ